MTEMDVTMIEQVSAVVWVMFCVIAAIGISALLVYTLWRSKR